MMEKQETIKIEFKFSPDQGGHWDKIFEILEETEPEPEMIDTLTPPAEI